MLDVKDIPLAGRQAGRMTRFLVSTVDVLMVGLSHMAYFLSKIHPTCLLGWIWYPYFCLYSPKKAFLDRTWVLPDIEKAK